MATEIAAMISHRTRDKAGIPVSVCTVGLPTTAQSVNEVRKAPVRDARSQSSIALCAPAPTPLWGTSVPKQNTSWFHRAPRGTGIPGIPRRMRLMVVGPVK